MIKSNNGASRKPEPKFINDYFREYNLYMEENNINAYVVTISVNKLVCAQNLGLRYAEVNYNGPNWKAKDDAIDIVREKDAVTPYDADMLCNLAQLIRQNGTKQDIKILVNKNLKQMLESEGLIVNE